MDKLRKIFLQWGYADSSKTYFSNQNRNTLCRLNLKFLFYISGIALCLLAGFFLFSPFLPVTSAWYYVYGAYGVFDACIFVTAAYYRSRPIKPKTVETLCLLFFAVTLLFGVVLSVFFSRNSTGSIFLLFVSSGQLMFILPPLYSTATAAVGGVVMSVCSLGMKTNDLASIDVANSVCALVLGGFLCWYITCLRIHEYFTKQEVLELNSKLETLSTTDPLTGLTNRRKFNLSFDETFRLCRDRSRTLAFIMADLDSFKPYNDHYGHMAGDDCLRRVGSVFLMLAEKYNLTPIRYGGEEFALLGTGLTRGDTYAISKELVCSIQALHIPHAYSETGCIVTISCGVHCAPVHRNTERSEPINAADRALYRAKRLGGNRSC